MDLYCFDFEGAYLGYMQSNGDFFDSWGRRWARLDSGGALYDLDGRHRGHVDAQGSLFDEHGRCWGYLRGWTDVAELLADRRAAPTGAEVPEMPCA
jgi:hypothetical protein